jgi:DNA-binding response OmpR family regulator
VILDLMLPRMDGLQICRRLRTDARYTPILMLTAKSSELDRVLGLELGADDYLTKPFSMLELAARVKAVFRRADHQRAEAAAQTAASQEQVILAGGLRIDLHRHETLLDGKPVELTAKEFELLVYFARSPGRVHTRAQLLDQVWGYSHSGYEHTVNSHINRLRNKIERDPGAPDYIQTVWGVGYKFGDPRGS